MEVKNQKYDRSNMRRVILEFPKQFRIGLEVAKNVRIENCKLKIENLIVCGMGGSALPGDILGVWLNDQRLALPIHIHRNYDLPYWVNKNHLIICISYSGKTEETLDSFEAARKNGLKIVAIASGGKLSQLCQKHKIPLALVPQGFQPRMALGFQFAALMKILKNCGLIKSNLEDILSLEKNLRPETLETEGKKLAEKLKNKIPLIYASERLKSLARIWKIKFNENSKSAAFYNYFPELNHNEMAGFREQFSDTAVRELFSIIILRDLADHPRNLKRMQLTAKILRDGGVSVDIIDITGKDMLSRIFSNTLLADWVSYYLALEYKVDPRPIEIIEEFKNKL